MALSPLAKLERLVVARRPNDRRNFHRYHLSSEREAGPVSCPESTDRFRPRARFFPLVAISHSLRGFRRFHPTFTISRVDDVLPARPFTIRSTRPRQILLARLCFRSRRSTARLDLPTRASEFYVDTWIEVCEGSTRNVCNRWNRGYYVRRARIGVRVLHIRVTIVIFLNIHLEKKRTVSLMIRFCTSVAA